MKEQEHKLQVACVRWFRYSYPDATIFAIPNGGQRHPRVAKKLKSEGQLAGVADLFIMRPSGKYHGLFIEMKIKGNYQTEAQRIFQSTCHAEGYDYQVCRSFEQFVEVVEGYVMGLGS